MQWALETTGAWWSWEISCGLGLAGASTRDSVKEGLPGRQDDTAVKGKEMMTEFSEKKMDISSQWKMPFQKQQRILAAAVNLDWCLYVSSNWYVERCLRRPLRSKCSRGSGSNY